MAFPNSPVPSWYRYVKWKDAGSKRNGVHYVGDTVTITLNSALAANITYEVRDYYGTVVSSGSVSSGQSSFTPTAPGGEWPPGWYRLYLIGTQHDDNFEYSCGATNFCVIRDDSHFVPMPAGNVNGGLLSEVDDMIGKGVMGIGTTRLQIADAANYTSGADSLANCENDLALTNTYWVDPGAPYADSSRPRYAWCQFPNGGVDVMTALGNGGRYAAGFFLCADETVDGSQIFVAVSNGTTGGTKKVTVYSPDAGTQVETHDNLADNGAIETAFSASAYIRFFGYSAEPIDNFSAAAIGHAKFAGVSAVVADLYPLGCTYFEGPWNEPLMSGVHKGLVAHAMRLFQAAVHDGDASAKAIGPCYVGINAIPGGQGWEGFFTNNGHTYCDELSFHAYSADINGDLNYMRYRWQAFADMLSSYGVSKTLWQTESTNVMTAVYGVYHPRRARVPLLQTLLMEQFGVVKERNNYWYDQSHGFWSFPAWWENEDGSLQPQAVLYRVLAEETWGKPYSSALSFGTIGDGIFIGNVYSGAAGKTIALMATSFMPNASVTLAITGSADPVTVVDGFGNESTVALSGGQVTVQLADVPSYVRLSSAASATVDHVNNWLPGELSATSLSPAATTKQIDGVTYASIADDGFETWVDGTGIAPATWAEPPSTSTLLWDVDQTVSRVIAWCGQAWQTAGTLIDFDVQTYDGATWTSQKTVTKTSGDYFTFGTDYHVEGCIYETFWDEQWVFDVKLDAPVTCRGVRLNVHEASYGGEPLSDQGSFGQGNNVQGYRLQEIGVYYVEPSAARGLVSWARLDTRANERVGVVPI